MLRPVWQGWSQACGLVSPRCTALQPAPPRRVYTPPGPGARLWALRLSCGVLVGAAEKALYDRNGSLVRMVRSPCEKRRDGRASHHEEW